MAKKDQEKVNFLEPEETNESSFMDRAKQGLKTAYQTSVLMSAPLGAAGLPLAKANLKRRIKRANTNQFTVGRGNPRPLAMDKSLQ